MKYLNKVLELFRVMHGTDPKSITVTPLAAVALSLKHELTAHHNPPIRIEEFSTDRVVRRGRGDSIAIFLKEDGSKMTLRSCEILQS